MSAFPIWHVVCDKFLTNGGRGCWSGSQGDPEFGNPGEPLYRLEEELRSLGWVAAHGKHVCPSCQGKNR